MNLITHSSGSLSSQLKKVWRLSVPAILTQIATIIMQYIDSAMVGKLGANASAAIGLVASTTWLMNGIGMAVSVGFSVQVAQYIGAEDVKSARSVVRHGLLFGALFQLVLLTIGILISAPLPRWLGSDKALWQDASAYFFVFACSLPLIGIGRMAASFLQCSGNMVIPSVLNALMCALDVLFNGLLIPRYGVLGAAIGTALAELVACLLLLWFCCFRSSSLRIFKTGPFRFDFSIIRRALRIGTPVAGEEAAITGAMVVSTRIMAPLGPVAIAAHSFAITAESLCYMPAFGIGAAATTLVGQHMGAGERKQARQLANLTTAFGAFTMFLTGAIMYLACPLVFRMLTPVEEVRITATTILRIGLLAEPFYGISIVASGGLRGAEDTLVPSLLNLFSIWVVRIGLSLLTVGPFGIQGVWIAMAIELFVRGVLLLVRQLRSPHLK